MDKKRRKQKQSSKKAFVISDVSGSVVCRRPKPNCYSGVCENCGQVHEE